MEVPRGCPVRAGRRREASGIWLIQTYPPDVADIPRTRPRAGAGVGSESAGPRQIGQFQRVVDNLGRVVDKRVTTLL